MSNPFVRSATPEDAIAIAGVHTETWKSTYAGMIPENVLAQFTNQARREAYWRDQLIRETQASETRTWVAVDTDSIVAGLIAAGPAYHPPEYPEAALPYAGEVYAVYVHPRAQGQGFGAALMRTAATELSARGLSGLIVWCLETNVHARGFYERMGGQFITRRNVEMANAQLSEVGYGWAEFGPVG